jgi:hypothetical protein
MEPGTLLINFMDYMQLRHEDGSIEQVRVKVDRMGALKAEPYAIQPIEHKVGDSPFTEPELQEIDRGGDAKNKTD